MNIFNSIRRVWQTCMEYLKAMICHELKSIVFFNAEKGVPGFWLAAMKSHEVLAAEVCEARTQTSIHVPVGLIIV